eukprot:7740321-Alexandrium_andersonii.AAC.1
MAYAFWMRSRACVISAECLGRLTLEGTRRDGGHAVACVPDGMGLVSRSCNYRSRHSYDCPSGLARAACACAHARAR